MMSPLMKLDAPPTVNEEKVMASVFPLKSLLGLADQAITFCESLLLLVVTVVWAPWVKARRELSTSSHC